MASASDADTLPEALPPAQTVGFIGCGNLGKAILEGIIRKSASKPLNPWTKSSYLVSVKSETTAKALRDEFARSISLEVLKRQNVQVAMQSSLVILACPPDAVETVLGEKGMAHALSQTTLVSLAAGVSTAQIAEALYQGASKTDLGDQHRCWMVRAMPNLAASVGASATGIALPTDPAPPKTVTDLVQNFFARLGGIIRISESQMDAASVVCGASPAFMALFCDAIIDGAVAGGLPRAQAELMTAHALGSTFSLLSARGGGKKPSELRENVCANPGITIGAMLNLEKGGVRGSISGAVRDAILSARSLS